MGTCRDGTDPYDIVIIGAGVSGINCAYRLQTKLPNAKFTILEARDNIGGTWDLFKYPGIRSDSDLYTYGFAWEPWPYAIPIAEGPLIMEYLQECVSKYGLRKYMNFRHKVLSGDWSNEAKKWTLAVDHDGQKKTYETTFLVMATGYYDYDTPLEAAIPGLGSFKGKVIHPQFWPTDYNIADKDVVVIGSGATAITIIPALANKVKHITMLQRSATWITSMSNRAPFQWSSHFLPGKITAWLEWLWFAIVPFYKVQMCLYYPELAKEALMHIINEQLPANVSAYPHFTPKYNPWEQRLCLAPDGDFFKCLHGKDGSPAKAEVVTAKIKTVTENGIMCEDGRQLDADVIVTATGLKMCWGGKISLRMDGERVSPGDHMIWNGCMMNSVPNMMFMVGYARASWTLGADDTAFILCRLWELMQKKGLGVAVPRPPRGWRVDEANRAPWLDLSSTYIKKSGASSPWNDGKGKGPWKARGNVWLDWIHARVGNITKALEIS